VRQAVLNNPLQTTPQLLEVLQTDSKLPRSTTLTSLEKNNDIAHLVKN